MVFSPVHLFSKQKREMCRYMKNPYRLKVRRYFARLIDLDEYLASFLGATISDNMVVTDLNEILLSSISNRSTKKRMYTGFIVKLFLF